MSSDYVKIAALQLTSNADVTKNLTIIRALSEKAAKAGAQLVALPENFAYFGKESEKIAESANISKYTFDTLGNLAKELKIEIMAGGFPVPAPDSRTFNTAAYFDTRGQILSQYHKVHLFDTTPGDGIAYRESDSVQAGKSLPEIFSICGVFRGGITICYDIRFPEIFRHLSRQGADIIFVPAAFTKITGEAHWHTLLRARGIENSCYIVAPAQSGKHENGKETYGHSLIIDPWGEVVAEATESDSLIMAEISREKISAVRERIPSLRHRVFG